jgi:hypothetical protein
MTGARRRGRTMPEPFLGIVKARVDARERELSSI